MIFKCFISKLFHGSIGNDLSMSMFACRCKIPYIWIFPHCVEAEPTLGVAFTSITKVVIHSTLIRMIKETYTWFELIRYA